MNCYVHAEKEAIGTCVGCGKFICKECCIEIKGKYYCKNCVNELVIERERKIEKLEDSNKQHQTMVFMNAGGGGGASSSSSSSSSVAAQPTPSARAVPVKSKIAAGLLAIFLGCIGAHKFYLGKPLMGLLYLIFCWTGIPAIVGLVEGIIYLSKSDAEFAAKYGAKYF
ncbi:MAG TPA: TM2 domain-containing protein [Thermoclostridium sp.]